MNFTPGIYQEAVNNSRSPSSSSLSSFHHMYGGGAALPPTSGGDETPDDSSEDHTGMLLMRCGGASSVEVVEREHMFDKVVTPSDVGKLNRLVIPKQHAEKYFPLDSSANEKGLLLNFEDRNGKPWRFRYSYWNSSQSYVMTKGWSRFVKEKKLDAGDIVSFHRGAAESARDRLFIDWRRRPGAPPDLSFSFPHHRLPNPWGPLFMHPPPPPPPQYHGHPYGGPYNNNVVNGNPCPPGSIMYLRSTMGGGDGGGSGNGGRVVVAPQMQMGFMEGVRHNEVFESVPVVVQGKAAAPKRLRLFGVNMDCCPMNSAEAGDHIVINNNNNHSHSNRSDVNECDVLMASSGFTHIHHHPSMMMMTMMSPSSSSSLSLARLRHGEEEDKGKGSMSLDLDI